MDLAMLAGRFFGKRATQAAFKSIAQKVATFCTNWIPVQWKILQPGLRIGDNSPFATMLHATVDRGKLHQHTEIFEFFAG